MSQRSTSHVTNHPMPGDVIEIVEPYEECLEAVMLRVLAVVENFVGYKEYGKGRFWCHQRSWTKRLEQASSRLLICPSEDHLMRLSHKQAKELGFDLPHAKRRVNRKFADSKPKKARQKDHNQARNKLFDALCESHGLPLPVTEYPFAKSQGRLWRFDFVWEGWLALEVQGGIYTAGRHVRGATLEKEMEKLNAAVLLGYSVLFCTPEDINSGAILETVKIALAGEERLP